ncbi:MAG: IS1182 family transposase [Rhizobacter sp.]|nr:IS1182 family transposase [Ferruginibacter sp.]
MQKFKPVITDQLFLLPPSIEDFIPQGHLARVVNDIVETIDVSAIEKKYSLLGQKSYHPHLLLKLLFYGYSTGVRSGRKIAMACQQDTAYMYLACMYRPDFRTINDFRKDNLSFVHDCFSHIVQICKQLGMAKAGSLILDGTKLRANASGSQSKNKEQYEQWLEKVENDITDMLSEAERNDEAEDKLYGNDRGDELPKELHSKQRLKEKIKAALEKIKDDKQRINLTDNDAKYIMGKTGIDTNYNCQAAITEDGIIVGAYTSNNPSDRSETIRSIEVAEQTSKEKYDTIIADSGYASYGHFETLHNCNKNIYMPDQAMLTEKEDEQKNPYHRNNFIYDSTKNIFKCPEQQELTYKRTSNDNKRKQFVDVYECKECPACDKRSLCTKGKYRNLNVEKREWLRKEIREQLQSIKGQIIYKKRMLIESVFGVLKHNLKYLDLNLRGIEKTTAEWQLICIGYNIKRIHKLKLS